MALITVDNESYVNGYFEGAGFNIEGAIEVELPFDRDELLSNMGAYRYVEGQFILDTDKQSNIKMAAQQEELRARRETECFPYINRGLLWYATLTEEQTDELEEWYKDWLDAPATLCAPNKLEWLRGE